MGRGDDIMGTGMARGARKRGKRIAFGDCKQIIWGPFSAEIFRGNPNIAAPGQERASDLEWIASYPRHSIYATRDKAGCRWIWNYEFRPIPGEIYFKREPVKSGKNIVVIEPNVPGWKPRFINKQWPMERYQSVADYLIGKDFRVIQPWYGRGIQLNNVELLPTQTFTDALALIKTAELFIGPEGGLHHGAAAVGTAAVVLFGGFIPPQVTGYDTHRNLTGGEMVACGSHIPCSHCAAAMNRISVDEVTSAAMEFLQ